MLYYIAEGISMRTRHEGNVAADDVAADGVGIIGAQNRPRMGEISAVTCIRGK